MKIKRCFKKTNTESYFRIQSSPPNGKVLSALALVALLFLPSQSISNPSLWEMNHIAIPLNELTGNDSDKIHGPTVFGINPENHSGTVIGYPVYYTGEVDKNGHNSGPFDVRMDFLPVLQFKNQMGRNLELGALLGDHHKYRIGAKLAATPAAEANYHNGANHVWLTDKLVAYHTNHLSEFKIWDVDENELFDGPIQGELSHNSWGGKLYFSRDMNRSNFPSPIGYADQGIFVYDVSTKTEQRVISKERIMRSVHGWPTFDIEDPSISTMWRTQNSLNHVEPSPSGDKVTVLYSYNITSNTPLPFDYEIDNADWKEHQVVVSIKRDPTDEPNCRVEKSDGSTEFVPSPSGDVGGCTDVILHRDSRPFHALWFDDNSFLAARPVVQRLDATLHSHRVLEISDPLDLLTISPYVDRHWREYLGDHAAHQGMASDAQWYASDVGPNGDYGNNPSSGKTEIYLSKRGQRIGVASLAKWWGNDFTWDAAAHANPSFSADGNRVYFLKGTYEDPEATLHYLDISAYRKTLHKYCAAGTPWNATGEERHLEAATLTRRGKRPDLKEMEDDGADDPLRAVEDPWVYFNTTTSRDAADGEVERFEWGDFLYGRPKSKHNTLKPVYDGEDYPPHGYDVSPEYRWARPVEVRPGATYYLEMLMDKDSRGYVASGAVDWNQNGWFADENIDESNEWVIDEVGFNAKRDAGGTGDYAVLRVKIEVPENAHAGDTVMRVRLHERYGFPQPPGGQRSSGFCNTFEGMETHTVSNLYTPNTDGSGIYKDTVTYDFPIKVKLKSNYTNACQDVGDVANTNANTDNSRVNTTWNGANAPGAFEDNDVYWDVEGSNEWIKKCYTTPQYWSGVSLDFRTVDNERSYKFDVEGLLTVNSQWVKLIENGRSLGQNTDRWKDGALYDRERFYFSDDLQYMPFIAVRFTGYGNDGRDGEDTVRYRAKWNNMRYLKMLDRPSSAQKRQTFSATDATFVRDAVDYVTSGGSTIYNRPNEDEGVYLEDTERGSNYGNNGSLEVYWTKNSDEDSERRSDALLKFTVNKNPGGSNDMGYYDDSGGNAQVERATLRLKVMHSNSGVTHRIIGYGVDWNEDTVTWDNAPTYPGGNGFDLGIDPVDHQDCVIPGIAGVIYKKAESCALLNAVQVPGTGQWLEVDVTEFVNYNLKHGKKEVGFRIVQSQPVDAARYSSGSSSLPTVAYFSNQLLIDRRYWPQLTYVLSRKKN